MAYFETTRWTIVQAARDSSDPASTKALEELCHTYWPPLYAFLRRQAHSREDSEDFIQSFFERLIARDYLKDVDWSKGRFRSFLLAALRHHAANLVRGDRTWRRGGRHRRLSLDEPGVLERCEATAEASSDPELAYDRVWAETVMGIAAQKLRLEYTSSGRGDLYVLLSVWLAKEPGPGEYAAVAPTADMTEGALAAAVFRLRRRFRELIRIQIAHTVCSPTDVHDELRYLFRVLAA